MGFLMLSIEGSDVVGMPVGECMQLLGVLALSGFQFSRVHEAHRVEHLLHILGARTPSRSAAATRDGHLLQGQQLLHMLMLSLLDLGPLGIEGLNWSFDAWIGQEGCRRG